MPPGTDQAAQDAIVSGGWPAWATLVVLLGGFGIVAVAIRQLWNDHRELNRWVRDDMAIALNSVALAFSKFTRTRPCLHDSDTLLEAAIGEDDEDLDEVGRKAKAYLRKVQERRTKQSMTPPDTGET